MGISPKGKASRRAREQQLTKSTSDIIGLVNFDQILTIFWTSHWSSPQWVGLLLLRFLQNSELDGLCPLIIRVYVGASTSVTTTRIMWHDKLERLRRQKERTSVLKFAIPRTRAPLHTRRLMLVNSVGSLAQQGGLLLSEAYHVPYYKSTRSSSSILNITDNLFLDSLGFN